MAQTGAGYSSAFIVSFAFRRRDHMWPLSILISALNVANVGRGSASVTNRLSRGSWENGRATLDFGCQCAP